MPKAERQWGKGQRSWLRDREGDRIEHDGLEDAAPGLGPISNLFAVREALASMDLDEGDHDGHTLSACPCGADPSCPSCHGTGVVG